MKSATPQEPLDAANRSEWKTDLVSNQTQTGESVLSEGKKAADRISPIHR